MNLRACDIIVSVLLHLLHSAYSDHILSCNPNALERDTGACPSNEICNQTSLRCDCLEGFHRAYDECVAPDNISYSPDTTAAVVTILTLALITVGLVLVARRYNLVRYVRERINLRRNNDVMYEDVMIGQDDPPLSP